ncbi:MAG: adenosine deaminase [Chloroflexi bacterium]|nr:adenosine deaminase [Chloroflexota bacterium]
MGNMTMDYRQGTMHKNPSLYEQIKALPKIELHRHLEGSLRLNTMAEIAAEHQLELPGYTIDEFRSLVQITPEDKRSAHAFLSKFKTLRQFFRSHEVIDRITYEIVADAAAENIVYMELRFTPMALASESGHSLPEVIDWVIAAVKRAMMDHPIDVRLITSMNRHETPAVGDWAVGIAIERMKDGVVAVDLAGDESQFPGKPFKYVFDKAHDAGLKVTIHAGEWAGPSSCVEAVEVLGAERLGHGVRLLEDKTLFHRVCRQNIPFEVCVTSNVQSGVADSWTAHPIREMFRLYPDLMTINSDDPSISAIDLTDELVLAMEHLEFTLDDVKQVMLNAANVAFLPEAERASLRRRLEAAFITPLADA